MNIIIMAIIQPVFTDTLLLINKFGDINLEYSSGFSSKVGVVRTKLKESQKANQR